jgi:hypothetical protein
MTTTTDADNESLDELFSCKICFNGYEPQNRKPMLLPCKKIKNLFLEVPFF